MRVLLINLDRHIDRRNWMHRELSEKGISYQRAPAVDARCLPGELLETVRKSYPAEKEITAGELACRLSHKRCWEIIANGEDEFGCVMEDDLHLTKDAAKFLNSHEWIPANADIVKIETFAKTTVCGLKGTAKAHDHTLRPLIGNHFGSGGYILSKTAAKQLLERYRNCHESMSFVLFSHKYNNLFHFRVLQLDPAICIQDMRLPASSRNARLRSTIDHDNLIFAAPKKKPLASSGFYTRRKRFLHHAVRNIRSQILMIWLAARYVGTIRRVPFDAWSRGTAVSPARDAHPNHWKRPVRGLFGASEFGVVTDPGSTAPRQGSIAPAADRTRPSSGAKA